MISISRPGILVKVMESHGKTICFWKIKRQKENKKFEKITDELKTGFNFSRNKNKHVMHFNAGKCYYMIVLILLSEQMRKLWSWKTWKSHGKGHGKSWIFKVVKEYKPWVMQKIQWQIPSMRCACRESW